MAKTIGGLEVDVHATRNKGHVDDVDVVGRVGSGRRHSRRLADTVETLAIAIDSLVNPVG